MAEYETTWKRNRPRKPLELSTLKLRLTAAIGEMERIIMTDEPDQKKIQAANTMAGLINRYSKLLEVADLEERITALEENQNNNMRRVS